MLTFRKAVPEDMDALLAQDGFNRGEYLEMRKKLNEYIEPKSPQYVVITHKLTLQPLPLIKTLKQSGLLLK